MSHLHKQPLYSSSVMMVMTLVFTPLVLAYMLYENYVRIGKSKDASGVVIASIIFFLAHGFILSMLGWFAYIAKFFMIGFFVDYFWPIKLQVLEAEHPERSVIPLAVTCLVLLGGFFWMLP